jgi:quercetin dioxygenase-like cupin family protein
MLAQLARLEFSAAGSGTIIHSIVAFGLFLMLLSMGYILRVGSTPVPLSPPSRLERRRISFEKTLMAEFLLKRGKRVPRHSHSHEQTGYLVRGRIRISIGPEHGDLGPGDSWCIPGNVEHGAEALEDSVALEVFSPVREDYLPKQA